MMKNTIRYTSFLFVLLLIWVGTACSGSPEGNDQDEGTAPTEPKLLKTILERDKLIAYTENSTTSYFIYRGQPMGFDYELFSRFAKELGVELEIRIVTDFDIVVDSLVEGHGDLGGGNYTITAERQEKVSFSEPLTQTRQVLVQRLPKDYWKFTRDQINDSLVRDPIELVGKEIYVRKSSSFYQRLKNIESEIGQELNIIEAPIDWETEDLIRKVAQGEIDYTVTDQNVGRVNKLFYDNIDVNTPLSFNQQIAWLVDKDANELLDTLNTWLNTYRKTTEFAVIYNKYFKYKSQHKRRISSNYAIVDSTGNISPYDELIKQYANKIDWDWRLVAAMIFKESNFDASVNSWTGATGLMQILPSTAADYGYDSVDLHQPEVNIAVGTRYLDWIADYWYEQLPDSAQAKKFALASYNVGLGHVKDAQRLADKYDLDPTLWDDNVEAMLKQKSEPDYYRDEVVKHGYCRGIEPVQYVQTIYNRYNDYKNLVPEG